MVSSCNLFILLLWMWRAENTLDKWQYNNFCVLQQWCAPVYFLLLEAPIIQIWGKESTSHQQLLVKMSRGELQSVDKSQQAECQLGLRGRSTWWRKHKIQSKAAQRQTQESGVYISMEGYDWIKYSFVKKWDCMCFSNKFNQSQCRASVQPLFVSLRTFFIDTYFLAYRWEDEYHCYFRGDFRLSLLLKTIP